MFGDIVILPNSIINLMCKVGASGPPFTCICKKEDQVVIEYFCFGLIFLLSSPQSPVVVART